MSVIDTTPAGSTRVLRQTRYTVELTDGKCTHRRRVTCSTTATPVTPPRRRTDPVTVHPIDTDRLLARIARLEAQSDIRGRAVVIYRDRARKAEAERDWNLRSSRLAKGERIKANARAESAEARIKAVEDVLSYADMGETLVTRSRIRRALDGDA